VIVIRIVIELNVKDSAVLYVNIAVCAQRQQEHNRDKARRLGKASLGMSISGIITTFIIVLTVIGLAYGSCIWSVKSECQVYPTPSWNMYNRYDDSQTTSPSSSPSWMWLYPMDHTCCNLRWTVGRWYSSNPYRNSCCDYVTETESDYYCYSPYNCSRHGRLRRASSG